MRAAGGQVGWREGRRMVAEEDTVGVTEELGETDGGGGRNTGGNTEWNKLNLASLHAAGDARDGGGGGVKQPPSTSSSVFWGGSMGGKGSSARAGVGGGAEVV